MTFNYINNPVKSATLDDGQVVQVGFSNRAKHTGCDAHFSFMSGPVQSIHKKVTIDGIRYQIVHNEPSPYINGMWTFHIKKIE
jgi:hypothetical protein